MRMLILALAALLIGCGQAPAQAQIGPPPAGVEEAVFAGGCFWCTEAYFQKMDGVVEVISGYTGGKTANPSYEQISTGLTGHKEGVLVRYDPKKITYAELVERYWRTIDPTDNAGQFCDKGSQYRSAIFVTPKQRPIAEASKQKLAASGILKAPIATEILPRGTFWPAEARHQDYFRERALAYAQYRAGCGTDRRLDQIWGAKK